MATLLYRLGRASARRGAAVIGIWVILLVAAVAGVAASGAQTDDEFRIPGTESQQALDVLAERFPAASGTSAQVVFIAPEGGTITAPQTQAAIARALSAARTAPQVAAVVDPFTARTVSRDQRVALAQVQYPVKTAELEDGSLEELERRVAVAEQAGLRVVVGGDAYQTTGVPVGATELIGVVVALVVLLVTFGSLLAAGMTLVAALLGVGVGLAGLLSLTELITLSSTAPTLALMIGLAVGIDYSLFLLSRHRAQLAEGMSVPESIGRATGTAGGAVVFAGLTVIIAMAGLAIVRIPFLTVMGLAASLTVAIAVAVAITLLPALLGLAGERLRPRPGSRTARLAAGEGPGSLGERWARLVIARPAVTVLVLLAGLGVLALPARDLSLALPDHGRSAPESNERQAYDIISASFGPGFNGPLLLMIEPGSSGKAGLQQAAGRVAAEVARTPGVVGASAPQLSPDGNAAIVQVIPRTGPADEATADLVRAIRDRAGDLEKATGTSIAVTGSTAAGIDVSQRLSEALPPFAAVVVGLALVLLLLVFRSVVVPVKAAVGFLLSVGAAFGIVVAVFQWGWLAEAFGAHTTGPVISFLPIIVIAVLFGLAMDYEVFLVSRIREDFVHGAGPREAIVAGSRHAARVVTAAALIMFSVFASFVTTEDMVVKPMALALAAGVLVDAFVVRMTLVPAVLALTGRAAWWLPARLDRVLPRVDIEGESLAAKPAPPPAPQPAGLPR
ncbi:MMPL family transporter [Thermomonospora catenispora]|uniref:MMPL family transporter n=1 Tax=Thermomonospora catenispora TaxID=2493090 RepID=UPI0011239059|nr:MMPL family transporter [Thermomonospora catenispora]TNY36844.1 MMPL family transporter [Thermomonospora catenispora]